MKPLLPLLFLLSMTGAHAQIHNGGFEDLNDTGFPAYWQGRLMLLEMWVDSNGVFHTDSVVFDGGALYALTDDVHSGEHAVELRNAYNYTDAAPIAGGWLATNDSTVYSGFNLVFLTTEQQPQTLSFWAKYLPQGGDVGYVQMDVYDEGQEIVGTGALSIAGTFSEYTLFEVPITYSGINAPTMFTLNFSTASPTSSITFGTRFLIDDVQLDQAASVSELDGPALRLFPVPAQDRLTVRTEGVPLGRTVRITDVSGRITLLTLDADGVLDCGALANGHYTLELPMSGGPVRRSFLVTR